MSLLKIATYSLDTPMVYAVAATLMMAFITQLYGFNVVVPTYFYSKSGHIPLCSHFEIVRTVLFYRDTLN